MRNYVRIVWSETFSCLFRTRSEKIKLELASKTSLQLNSKIDADLSGRRLSSGASHLAISRYCEAATASDQSDSCAVST